ncbi:MAG TPA: DUF5908 family protein [Puia sp.]|nr:DUF5908 family protein [Puia sp.]
MIEIRELIIKAVVQQNGAGKGNAGAPATANSVPPNEELIKACVEKVIEILKEKNER